MSDNFELIEPIMISWEFKDVIKIISIDENRVAWFREIDGVDLAEIKVSLLYKEIGKDGSIFPYFQDETIHDSKLYYLYDFVKTK